MPNHCDFFPSDGNKNDLWVWHRKWYGPTTIFHHTKKRINFFLTQKKTKNCSFTIEAVKRSIRDAAHSYITASQTSYLPHMPTQKAWLNSASTYSKLQIIFFSVRNFPILNGSDTISWGKSNRRLFKRLAKPAYENEMSKRSFH